MFLRPLILITLLPCSVSAAAAEWNRFRGPNGTGVSSETHIPAAFGAATNIVWKTPLPDGNSSPVFGRKSIFVTGYEGGKLFTIALDRKSGRVKWRREIIRAREGNLREPNNPASPSAATDGENVFVFFQDFGMAAYGADGNELWRIKQGPFNNPMGLAASPIYVNGKVIQVCDSETGSYMYAADAKNGEIVWRNERPYSLRGFSTPVLYQPEQGGLQVVVAGSYELAGFDVESGEKVWFVQALTWQLKPTPVIDGHYAYVLGWAGNADLGLQEDVPSFAQALEAWDGDNDGKLSREELLPALGRKAAKSLGSFDLDLTGFMEERDWEHHRRKKKVVNAMRKIKLGGKGDMTAGAVAWSHYKSLPNVPSPLLHDGVVYLVKDAGIFTALDAADGRVLKQGRLREAMDRYFASPVAADGKIFTADESGKVSVIAPGAAWEVLRTNDMQDEIHATPAFADGRLFIRTKSALYCFAAPD